MTFCVWDYLGSGSVDGSRFVRSPIALETLTKTNMENFVIA